MLGKSSSINNKSLVPKEEQQRLLPSSKVADCCSPLGFNSNSELLSDDFLLDYFADILVDIIIEQLDYEQHTNAAGGDLLPGVNQGAG